MKDLRVLKVEVEVIREMEWNEVEDGDGDGDGFRVTAWSRRNIVWERVNGWLIDC